MRALKIEIHRAFFNKNMLSSLLMGIVIVFADLALFSKTFLSQDRVLVQAWIGTNYLYVYPVIYYTLFSIMACLPFGGSLYLDITSGYDKNICIKTSRIDYISSKCIAVFLSGAFAVAFPLFMNFFIASGLFPSMQPERLEFTVAGAVLDIHFLSEVFDYNASLYCIIYIFIDALFGGAIALVSLAITKLTGNLFTVTVIPFVLVLYQAMFMYDDNKNWAVMEMIKPDQQVVTPWLHMLMAYILILLVSLAVSIMINRKRDIL